MKNPRVAIFIHHPECSVQSAHGILKSLSPKYTVDFFGHNEITDTRFDKCDLIAFPGGIGDSESWHRIIGDRADVIRNQVEKHKPYLGICMGAYWAGPHYFDLVQGLKTPQYIKRRRSDIKRSFATTTPVIWQGHQYQMFFYDGCSLLSQDPNVQIVARYSNGDPAAIIKDSIGLIGPHPESDSYWYYKSYLTAHWHDYHHNKLLLNFVDTLINQ